MAVTHPTAVRNGIADFVVDQLDEGTPPGKLIFRTAGDVPVATLTFSNPAFGAAVAGVRTFQVFGAASVASVFEIQYRNAANNGTLKSQILAVPASGTASFPPIFPDLSMADNERIRIIQVAAVTGNVSVSLDIV